MVWSASIALFAFQVSTPASRHVRVADHPTCSTCRIEIVRRGDLHEAEEAGDLSSQVRSAVLLADGSLLVTQYSPKLGLPLRFDSTGHYLGPVSRSGAGPQEFRHATHVASYRGDSVLVLDARLRRVSIISESGRVGRSTSAAPLAGSRDAATFGDGQVVAATDGLTRAVEGEPLHIYSADFLPVRSFGAGQGGDGNAGFSRRVAVSTGTTFWAAQMTSYVVERWSRDGQLLLTLKRDAPWFGPNWHTVPRDAPTRPPALVQGIREDREGLLWIFITVPDPKWRTAYGAPRKAPPRPGSPPTVYPIERWDRLVDTMIEVLDPARGVVIARRRIDEVVLALYGTSFGVATAANGDEEATVLLAFQLVGLKRR